MNYLRHYDNLINRARNRKIFGYTESHHIVPRCMGGTDDLFNLVDLTPEEHYVAHQLLVKIYPENHKLVYAATMMCVSSKSHRSNRSRNKLYGWIKKRLVIAASINGTGENGSQFGTCWVHSVSQQVSKKIHKSQISNLEDGWKIGRVMKFDKPVKVNKRNIIKSETDSRYLTALLGAESISDALRLLGLKTSGAGYNRMKQVIKQNNLQGKFPSEKIIWD